MSRTGHRCTTCQPADHLSASQSYSARSHAPYSRISQPFGAEKGHRALQQCFELHPGHRDGTLSLLRGDLP